MMIRGRFAKLKGWGLNCYHCCQIDLPFSVRDGLGLTRRYSKASGEVLTNSGIQRFFKGFLQVVEPNPGLPANY